ncbi:MAG: hypothetical protein FJ189_00260 [Gammaproteobacteria bacterium]|nr:hypothetical protein [Chloroflexota bacterium]MBM4199706.1 hypothetical protein [Gammaproteobacteria bacterium]
MTRLNFRGEHADLAHNMSAPPRSTVSFRPYGTAVESTGKIGVTPGAAGLRHVLRADPDALLAARLPDTVRRMRALRADGLDAARGRYRQGARASIARVRALRLAGLVTLASSFEAGAPAVVVEDLADQPLEALQDRLADLAGRLPPCPALPAMAVAESLAGGVSGSVPGSTDVLAVLWTLTHLNGRTFDRDGLPILAPDLAEGGAWDFYAP